MPAKQTLPLPFIGGVDTRTDPLQILPPKMAALDNALFVPGGIRQRHGMKKIAELSYIRDGLTPSFADDVPVSKPRMLLTRDGDLAMITDSGFYNLAPGYGKWHREINLSTVTSGLPMNTVRSGRLLPSIQLTTGTVYLADLAITDDGLMVVAYEDLDSSSVSYAVFDSITGSHIGSGAISVTPCLRPRAVSLGGSVIVFGVDKTASPHSIRAVVVSRASAIKITALEAIVTSADVSPIHAYDVVGVRNGRALIAYSSSTANTIKHGWVDGSLASSFTSQATAGTPQMICVSVDADRSYGIAWGMSTVNRVDAAQYTEASVNKFAAVTASVGTINALYFGPSHTAIAGVFSRPGLMDIFYDGGGAITVPHALRLLYMQMNSAGGIAIPQQTCTTGVQLWSRAWAQGQTPLVLARHVSTKNGFIVGPQATGVIGQFMPGEVADGLGASTSAHPFGGCALGSRMIFALPWLPGGIPLGTQLPGAQILRSCEIDFDDMQGHQQQQVGECTYISGSMMRVYDGLSMVESGFLTSPYLNVAAVGAATGGGLLPSTTYHYRLIYEAYTHDGSRFRSDGLGQGAGDALDFSVTTGGADNCTNITFPPYTPSLRGVGTYCGFVLYRRQQVGTIYNRVSTANPASPSYQKNNPIGFALLSIQDTMAEASLIQQELDDISQGIATPTFPPPHSVMRSGNGRVFISGMDDPDVIMYSLQRSTGEPLQFTSENRIVVQQGDGPVTALVAIGDSLVVFRKNQVYICGGEGLDNTGATGLFTTPRLISGEIGCNEPRSIVELPGGAAFKSSKGYYILSPGDSGLGLNFIGADVDIYRDLVVNAAVLMPRLHQIRWVTDEITLVYDYEFKQWSRFTYGGRDAVIWNGDFILLPGDTGRVLRETEGYWLDDLVTDGQQYGLVAESGWIRAEAITGRQRLYEVLVSGAKVSDHVVTILLAYDGEPAWVDRRTWNPQDVIGQAGASYGGQKYGVGKYGGTNVDGSPSTAVYQFSVKPRVQRCSMVKFRIEMGPPPGATWSGGSATLAEVALVLGVREGAVKLGKGKRA